MKKYLLNGKLTAKQGKRDELSQLLIEASKLVSKAQGCRLYVIGIDDNDHESLFVTEIWDTRDDHDSSLDGEGVRELLSKAMPLLDGYPTKGQELEIVGGFGIRE